MFSVGLPLYPEESPAGIYLSLIKKGHIGKEGTLCQAFLPSEMYLERNLKELIQSITINLGGLLVFHVEDTGWNHRNDQKTGTNRSPSESIGDGAGEGVYCTDNHKDKECFESHENELVAVNLRVVHFHTHAGK